MTEYRLTIISGNSVGKTQILNSFPATLGRSSKNDFSIPDEMLSRHHCSIDMRGDELWLTDLASANGTSVNGKFVDDVRLTSGDTIQLGDTVIKLTIGNENATIATPTTNIHPIAIPEIKENAPKPTIAEKIDLGLNASSTNEEDSEQKKNNTRSIINLAIVALVTIVIVGIGMFCFNSFVNKEDKKDTPKRQKLERSLEFHYCEIEASDNNIFRYELKLSLDGILTVSIDDLSQNRHLEKKTPPINKELILDLLKNIEQSGFTSLADIYEDSNKQGEWIETTITIVNTKDAKTVTVLNKQAPNPFIVVRDILKDFAETELNLESINYSKEKLEQLAAESLQIADKFYAEMEIASDNLFKAILNYSKTIDYLENISPKPEAYDIAFDKKRETEALMKKILEEKEFEIERATNLKDWETAAEYLRELCAMIPDKHDARHIKYNRQLLQVEARLNKNR
ncbi:MAG: FHA domain-containing protein [Kiritimatiellae bacterium]|nr:FHA domain-containing protein [Kiritimatiellia bacterium]